MKISATIITFNEERNIARVLESGSNDRTAHGYSAERNIAAELWPIEKTSPQCAGYRVRRLAKYLGRRFGTPAHESATVDGRRP